MKAMKDQLYIPIDKDSIVYDETTENLILSLRNIKDGIEQELESSTDNPVANKLTEWLVKQMIEIGDEDITTSLTLMLLKELKSTSEGVYKQVFQTAFTAVNEIKRGY